MENPTDTDKKEGKWDEEKGPSETEVPPPETSRNEPENEKGHPMPTKADQFTRSERASAFGMWTSLGSRRIRFASQVSDDNEDERRGIVATPLDQDLARPMGAGARFLKNFQTNADEPKEGSDDLVSGNRMYRLQATRTKEVGCFKKFTTFILSIVNCGALTDSTMEQSSSFMGLPNPNAWLVDFFYWLFRKGWTTIISLSLVMFYALVLFFTLLVIWAANIDDDCVRVGGEAVGTLPTRSRFFDAFALSWNTFSTVGYGSTYPALSTEHDQNSQCAFIAFITSLEALVGVIFAGFVGAIIFAKVTRITQRATVKFSDPLLLKYGSGVTYIQEESKENNDDKSDEADASVTHKASKPPPFPVLEFRIANELHDTLGGEIIASNVNAVVIIEATKSDWDVSNDLENQIVMNRLKRSARSLIPKKRPAANGKVKAQLPDVSISRSVPSEDSSLSDVMENSKLRQSTSADTTAYLHSLNILASRAIPSFGSKKKMKIDEEGSESQVVPRMIFSKLELDNSEHPFFKRVWSFKHIIDQESPLLTTDARKTIMKNDGNWPSNWNNVEAIRKAIKFNQIVVSFTGVSNISAASVYHQKVYDYVDYIVGYQFVNPLYREPGGKLKVDLNLISDVIEQSGGGGEPLNIVT